MQCIVVKSDEFKNSSPLYIFPLNPDYVTARSLRSPQSNNFAITVIYLSSQEDVFLKILLTKIVFSEVKKKEDDL